MDIQAAELAELLKLAGVESSMQPEPELELPMADEELLLAPQEPEIELGGQEEAPCDMAMEPTTTIPATTPIEIDAEGSVVTDDMMQTGTRVEYRDDIEDEEYTEESIIPGDDLDLQNGYDRRHAINGDDYGFDNDESTTDDNEIAVRESEVKYQGAFDAGKRDALAGKKVSDINVSDKYAFEGGDYLKGHSEGTKELDDKKQTESIHESLVYKYRDFKKKVNESYIDGDEEIYEGDRVVFKQGSPYFHSGVFIASQIDNDRNRCWIGDPEDNTGWYVDMSELEHSYEPDEDDDYGDDY